MSFWRVLFSIILIFNIAFFDVSPSSFASTNEVKNQRLEAYAIKHPLHVYERTNKNSKVLKSYNYNDKLVLYTYSSDWYRVTVYLNGIAYRGYVAKEDVGNNQNASVKGIALNNTNIYSSTDSNKKVLKTYKKGTVLKYSGYKKDWYIATIYINGKRKTGYISKRDVETLYSEQESLKGIGVKNPTKIYSLASTNSKAIKSYKQGQILRFKSFAKNWYEATVYVNGVRKTGYIHAKDIELINDIEQVAYEGIGIKSPTKIYSSASTNSNVLKSYNQGQILRYKSLTKNWYEATVYVNGVRKTGYIHSKDIETINRSRQESLNGVALKQSIKTHVYASKSSKVLRSYEYGHVLKFKTFSKDWYEATVIIDGKRYTGYISKDDVNTNVQDTLKGYALSNKTAVYSNTNRNSKVLKRYTKGHLLQYQSHNSKWFKARVYVNGQAKTGYINTSDVSPNPLTLNAYAQAKPTNVYNSKSKTAKVLKSYKQGTLMKLRYHNTSWYEATVYIKGKPNIGYVHVNDVGSSPPKSENQNIKPPSSDVEAPSITDKPKFDIPILMYHQIGENPTPDKYGLFVTAENFKEQMSYLKSKGYTLINFDELPNIKNIKKPIIVTFDDGYENNMTAYEVLSELKDDSFNPRATFFIIGSKINVDNYLSADQIRDLSNSGIISIQSHTMTHPHFNDKEKEELLDYNKELLENKLKLEEITGKRVNAIAYPYGGYNDVLVEETKKHYDYAVTTRFGIASLNDPYNLSRVRVSFDTTLEQFKKSIGEK